MKKRYHILDEIRGITLCSMILYHTVWDLVYMFGRDWAWYTSDFAFIWQQSICWSFILLSGFCFSLGKRKLRRGLIVFGAGALVSLVTEIAMPANRIRFGVLTLLGSSMLILAVWEMIKEWSTVRKKDILAGYMQKDDEGRAEKPVKERKISAKAGMLLSFVLFALTKRINYGYLGFADVRLLELPDGLYELGEFGNFLGFTESSFFSTDYFSLMPWFFLFLTGFYLHKYFVEQEWLEALMKLSSADERTDITAGQSPTDERTHTSTRLWSVGKLWRWMGKHSLLIYMLHQPVIYVILLITA